MKTVKWAMTAAVLALVAPAMAYEAGDMIVRVGAAVVNPNDDSDAVHLNGAALPASGVSVNSDMQLGITFTYMVADQWGIELLAASPFKHTVAGSGAILGGLGLGDIADVKHLPPTLSAQYYFNGADSRFQPYVGLGVNYTAFFDEEASAGYEAVFGPSEVDLENSWGLAAQLGFDFQVAENLRLNAAVWYIDIDTEATLRSPLSPAVVEVDVDIDPLVYMIGLAYQF